MIFILPLSYHINQQNRHVNFPLNQCFLIIFVSHFTHQVSLSIYENKQTSAFFINIFKRKNKQAQIIAIFPIDSC